MFLAAIESLNAWTRRAVHSPCMCRTKATSDAKAAADLPRQHEVPFDRMLIAHARRRDPTLISRDSAFARYGVPLFPA
jgi:PIN domain nuclease of toxin-antitoxin system